MNNQYKDVPLNIKPVDLRKMTEETGNVYMTIAILGKRANQIAQNLKQELTQKLAEFAPSSDNLEEVFENREQIEIAKFYETLPKPTLIAIDEFQKGKVYFKDPNKL